MALPRESVIPIVDLAAQYSHLKDEIDAAISGVIRSGRFILGPEVENLEKEIARFCKAPFACGCGSGTDGLYLSLLALDIKAGDEIITTPFTFAATAEVIALLGARPVFADINPRTLTINPESVKKVITSRTRAIIPVHLYGQIAEMKEIMEIAEAKRLKVIEDGAQALGSMHYNKHIGSFGHAAVISFFPTKNLGAYGDGGMILTKDRDLAEKIKALRNHGSRKKYSHFLIGMNSRLDSIQAAILRVKLKYLKSWNEKRKETADIYNRLLKDTVTIPYKETYNEHIYHQYTIRVKERDILKDFLYNNGIETAIHYPVPLHLQESFRYLGYKRGGLPESEFASCEVLSLPVYPELGLEKAQRVAFLIKEFYSRTRK
jgi:dTDP-4-amino-4,6-dideoxygalactose transaminase